MLLLVVVHNARTRTMTAGNSKPSQLIATIKSCDPTAWELIIATNSNKPSPATNPTIIAVTTAGALGAYRVMSHTSAAPVIHVATTAVIPTSRLIGSVGVAPTAAEKPPSAVPSTNSAMAANTIRAGAAILDSHASPWYPKMAVAATAIAKTTTTAAQGTPGTRATNAFANASINTPMNPIARIPSTIDTMIDPIRPNIARLTR